MRFKPDPQIMEIRSSPTRSSASGSERWPTRGVINLHILFDEQLKKEINFPKASSVRQRPERQERDRRPDLHPRDTRRRTRSATSLRSRCNTATRIKGVSFVNNINTIEGGTHLVGSGRH